MSLRGYGNYYRVTKIHFIIFIAVASIVGIIVGGLIGSLGNTSKYENLLVNLFENTYSLQVDAGGNVTIQITLNEGNELRAYVAVSGATIDADFSMTGPTGSLVYGPTRVMNEYKFVYQVIADGNYTITVDNAFSANTKNVNVVLVIV